MLFSQRVKKFNKEQILKITIIERMKKNRNTLENNMIKEGKNSVL